MRESTREVTGRQLTHSLTHCSWSAVGARPGRVEGRWDHRDELGRLVGSGIYFVRLQTPNQTLVRRVIVVR